ncbi:Oidioi.mRNA.OKI2018_I69.chr2.g5218.t1.cds [Oikopleura dioica]|uniref:Oidioi.mRNA.OKI2018_I69.chr2.g5218.t1.cds n=1 Tax=Oikopleura dioica TaxID=34765 RepID=A0ABN7T3E7_OIKDI|nr:Oidioi.mRNA.OKI2018_I69.chr2.g5218.t1.cds [Oikopleura dioica]
MIFAEVRHSSWASILNGMTVIFASLNSCLNPVIYAFLKPNLRKHLIGVIRHREVSGHGLFSPRPSIRKRKKVDIVVSSGLRVITSL